MNKDCKLLLPWWVQPQFSLVLRHLRGWGYCGNSVKVCVCEREGERDSKNKHISTTYLSSIVHFRTETQGHCIFVSYFLCKASLRFNRRKRSLCGLLKASKSVCVCTSVWLLKWLIYSDTLQTTYSQAPLWALTFFSAQTHHFPHFLCCLLPVSRCVLNFFQISLLSTEFEFAKFDGPF